MSRYLRLAAFTVFTLALAPHASAAGVVSDEDVAVLRAALASECTGHHAGYYVLSSQVADADPDDRVPDDWAEAKELTARLLERAASGGQWTGIRVCKKVIVRRDGDIQHLIVGARNLDVGWKNFYSAFPGALGTLDISLPAYSADANRAVIIIGAGCGSLCGSGRIVELEKKDGAWKIVRGAGLWIS